MRLTSTAPRTVLGAGALIGLQALVALGFTVFMVFQAFGGDTSFDTGTVLGEAAYFAVLTAGIAACSAGLLLGKTWSRSPSIVLQVLLAGAAWYALGPSGRPDIGIPVGLGCLVTLVLLFHPATTAWAEGLEDE